MLQPTTIFAGNLTSTPEIRYTNSGKPVANFTLAHNTRRQNAAGEWENGDTVFMRCSLWDKPAENLANMANKGQRLIAVGTLKRNEYTDNQTGVKHSGYTLTCSEVGISTQFAPKQGGGGNSAPQQQQGNPWGSSNTDEAPPF